MGIGFRLRCSSELKLDDVQAGDQLRMADVGRSHSVAELQRAGTDQQIREGIRAMHSEILRRTGSAGRITATGCASRSMMTSPPVSTRLRIDRMSRARSPSLMCSGSMLPMIPFLLPSSPASGIGAAPHASGHASTPTRRQRLFTASDNQIV
jgi:hypothetical protein